jgi:hypothetical protein
MALLLFAALACTVAMVGLVLLWHQSMTGTCTRLLEWSPAVVVRRVNAGGWAPLPVAEALAGAGGVSGVLQPRIRIWGVAMGPADLPVTVVGRSDQMTILPFWPDSFPKPDPGQAVIGPGFSEIKGTEPIRLSGQANLTLQVVGRLPVSSDLAVHDVVIVHSDDARRLLGLAPGMASDLTLEVFRTEEVDAVCKDLAAAFPWPVQLMTRRGRQELCLETLNRRSGAALLTFVPALLSLACLVGAVGLWGQRQRPLMGLLKALGWSSADILRLQAHILGLISVPAAAMGLAVAYGLLFLPAITVGWLNSWMGWSGPTHLLLPSFNGLLTAFGITLVVVMAPFLGAGLWVARSAALADPGDLLTL